MAFKIGANTAYTNDGIPFLWGSGNQTTAPSNQVKIVASDPAFFDEYGRSVAVGIGRIVVGAYDDDDNGSGSGSAYIYDFTGTQLAKIKASDGAAGDAFGLSVAVGSGRIVVGAYDDDDNGSNSGSAYIFDLNGNQFAKIKPSDGTVSDNFGSSVAVGSGRIVVGANRDDPFSTDSGSAYIFDLNGTQLAKIFASIPAPGDLFGSSVAVGCGRIVVGAYLHDDSNIDGGAAYIFNLSGTQLIKIKPSDTESDDFFGLRVTVGCGRIIVGAEGDDDNGSASGSAYIFNLDGTQLAKIKAPDGGADDLFGRSVSVGSGRIVVGATGDDDTASQSGAIYVFDLDGKYLTKIKASDAGTGDAFGGSVSINSGKIVVGAVGADSAVSSSGAAYIYDTPLVYTPYDAIELNSYGQ
jgi:hypothetical protein